MDRLQHAKAVAESDLIPESYRGQHANVLWAMDLADALGIPFPQVMQTMVVAGDRMTMSADIMAAVVRRAGHKLRVREQGMSVTATLIRRDDPDYEFSVTWDEAKARRAGLWGQRGPWSRYPAQMLRSRAITEVCRQGASDALAGTIYTPEELDSPSAPADLETDDGGPQGGAPTPPSSADPRSRSRALLAAHIEEHGGTPADVWQAAQDMGADPDDPDSVAACLAALLTARQADND